MHFLLCSAKLKLLVDNPLLERGRYTKHTATFFFILMVIGSSVLMGGVIFAFLGIVFLYTGRAMTYDRAGKMIDDAGVPIAPSSVQPPKPKKEKKSLFEKFKKNK